MVVSVSSLGSVTSFVLLSLFINALATLVPAQAAKNLDIDFLKQIEQSETSGLSPEVELFQNEPRLLDLLKFHDSMNSLFKDSAESDDVDDNEGTPSAHKRVFCNYFTGCGGRFRGRRRQQSQDKDNVMRKRLALKRPFCNNVGCYNGKKRVSSPKLSVILAKNLRAQAKRLFCNGYGGCQNMGKREESGTGLTSDEPDLPIGAAPSELDLRNAASKLKRFLNGGFDRNMESMVKSLRR